MRRMRVRGVFIYNSNQRYGAAYPRGAVSVMDGQTFLQRQPGLSDFCWPVRVYYEDTDSGGVVYYANYLRFMERARTERLRDLGFEQNRLRRDQGVLFTVHSIQVDFRKPARFNDALEVTADIADQRRASLTFYQEVRRAGETDVLCSGHVRVACVDAGSFRPAAIPSPLRLALHQDVLN